MRLWLGVHHGCVEPFASGAQHSSLACVGCFESGCGSRRSTRWPAPVLFEKAEEIGCGILEEPIPHSKGSARLFTRIRAWLTASDKKNARLSNILSAWTQFRRSGTRDYKDPGAYNYFVLYQLPRGSHDLRHLLHLLHHAVRLTDNLSQITRTSITTACLACSGLQWARMQRNFSQQPELLFPHLLLLSKPCSTGRTLMSRHRGNSNREPCHNIAHRNHVAAA